MVNWTGTWIHPLVLVVVPTLLSLVKKCKKLLAPLKGSNHIIIIRISMNAVTSVACIGGLPPCFHSLFCPPLKTTLPSFLLLHFFLYFFVRSHVFSWYSNGTDLLLLSTVFLIYGQTILFPGNTPALSTEDYAANFLVKKLIKFVLFSYLDVCKKSSMSFKLKCSLFNSILYFCPRGFTFGRIQNLDMRKSQFMVNIFLTK